MNAKRACGNTTCEGESAVLVVDRGRSNERFTVVFTSRGNFHQVVKVDRGTKQLKVRIDGPKRLDSGPFKKVDVDGVATTARLPGGLPAAETVGAAQSSCSGRTSIDDGHRHAELGAGLTGHALEHLGGVGGVGSKAGQVGAVLVQ